MIKRILSDLLLTFGLALVLLVVTCPSDDDYFVWLEKEYRIKCVDGNCTREEETIDWQSRGVQSTGIYNRVKDNYRGPYGEKIEIKALGILGRYYKY
jgi:hypothetical protein